MGCLHVVCCISVWIVCVKLVDPASVSLTQGNQFSIHARPNNEQDSPAAQLQRRHRHRHHSTNNNHGLPTTSQAEETCREGHFLLTLEGGVERCTPCSICPDGFGVKEMCGPRANTECERCDPDTTYLRNYFGVAKCLPCRQCRNRTVVRECTSTRDRVCGACKSGFFLDDMTDTCLRCSYCYPEIPNYGVVEPMCQSKDQPIEMTCLPSLPPAQLRTRATTTVSPSIDDTISATIERRVYHLDERLRKLGRTVDGEIAEVRHELISLRTVLKDRTA